MRNIFIFLIVFIFGCTADDPDYSRDDDIPCVECYIDSRSGLLTPYAANISDLGLTGGTTEYYIVNSEINRLNTYLTTASKLIDYTTIKYESNLFYIWLVTEDLNSDKNWEQFYTTMGRRVSDSTIRYLVIKRKNILVYLKELRVLLTENYLQDLQGS